MTLAVIVQARTGSTRFPGKVLEDLGGRSVLARVLDRCGAIPGADVVVAAIPDLAEDEALAAQAAELGAVVVRGSGPDVLARYAKAARAVGADTVMRVTSDCPFIDPDVCGQTIRLFRETGADYACNNFTPLFPHGLDCEVFSATALFYAEGAARDPFDREHVTPFLRRYEALTKAGLLGWGGGLEALRWTLDYPEDLAFFRAVYDVMGEGAARAPATDIARLCLARPDLAGLNAMRGDGARLAASQRADVSRQAAPFAVAA